MDGQDLQDEIRRLRNEINDLSRRLGEIEGRLLELSPLAASAAGRQRPAPPTVPPAPPRTAPAPTQPEATPLRKPLREVLESVGRVRAAAQAQAERPRPSLEQRLGVSWLSRIGIVVLILGAVFFFQYAVQQGWISKPVRVACGVAAGLALLGAGEWALRKGWRIFAASLTGGGIALLYLSVFAASPNWLKLIGTRPAFACMCLVTVIAVALSLRSRMLAAAVLAQVGAYLTPILLRTGQNEQVALMTYLLATGAGFLLLAALKRWQPLGPVALGGTAVVFALWFDQYQAQSPWAGTAAFAWGFFALFGAYAVLATALKRAHQFIGIALVAAAGGLQVLLWLGLLEEMADGELLGFLIALDAIVLGVCLLRGWHWLRAGAAAWTIVLMSWAIKPAQIGQPYGYSELWAIWIWLFFMVFTADVLVRAWWRRRETKEWLDAGLAAAATGIMFGATYGLLRQGYKPWMGAYTAALAAFAISLAWSLRRRAGRRVLSYAYLAEGLVLLTLAMPIQFDKATLTIAWAAQSTVAMLLARRLKNKLLMLKSPIVLVLAVAHFAAIDIPLDERLAAAAVTVGGTPIRYLLLLGLGLTASGLLSAGILRAGRAVLWKDADLPVACTLTAVSALVYGWQTWAQLPAAAATWWWLVLALGVAAFGFWRHSRWLERASGIMLAATALKFLAFDTLARRLLQTHEPHGLTALNWQFLAGVAIAAACLLYARALQRRAPCPEDRALNIIACLVGAFLILWAGSFEVDRFFDGPGARIFTKDPAQAQQMGYSVWWAVFAAGLLGAGFLTRRPSVRYMSLTVFAVTLGKVLLVDMAGIELAYRIFSFLGLGVLLVAASFLYQRYFQAVVAEWDKARE